MNGSFIAIEGSDGSGKTTQYRLLGERLRAVGYDVKSFDFPRYEQPSGYFVEQYLNGEFGPASQINPYTASLFFALDRFAAARDIQQALSEDKVVLSNRYTGSNMAHQGAKFVSEAEQRGFFVWADSLEFQLLGIPRPNLNVFLRVPAEISYELIAKKAKRSYTDKVHDEHEADLEHLKKSVAAYDLLCRLFPKDYVAVDCTQNGQLADIATINDRLWQIIAPYLPAASRRHKPQATTVKLDDPVAEASPSTDVNVQAEPLVAQSPVAVVLKSVSLLAVTMIQKSNIVVQRLKVVSTKSRNGSFYIPQLKRSPAKLYFNALRDIDQKRRQLLADLKKYLKKTSQVADISMVDQMLQPLATITSISIQAVKSDLASLANSLSQHNTYELATLAQKVGERGDGIVRSSESRLAVNASAEQPAQTHSTDFELIILARLQPRLEFDLLSDLLFEQSELSRDELARQISLWDYDRKAKLLNKQLAEPIELVARKLRNLYYSWDLVIDKPHLDKLIDAGAVELTGVQWPTPRFGYSIPQIVETAGLTDLYVDIFDQSLSAYSKLQDNGYHKEASYLTLSGHRQRWQVRTDYIQLAMLHNLSSDKTLSEPLKNIVSQAFEIVAQSHPLVASSILKRPPARTARTAARDLAASPAKATKKQVNPRSAKRRRGAPKKN